MDIRADDGATQASILVVDDLRSVRLIMGSLLEGEGYRVVVAENGYQAIEMVKETAIDLVFMDVKMPGINGVQAFREIKRISPETVVIMMTAYSVEDLVKEALAEGAYGVIYKPFDMEAIVATIKSTLHQVVALIIGGSRGLRAVLKAEGFDVVTTATGEAALAALRERPFDIILIDDALPDMDAAALLRRIREQDATVAVILLAGYAEAELIPEALRRGAYACVYKPLEAEKVLEAAKRLNRPRR